MKFMKSQSTGLARTSLGAISLDVSTRGPWRDRQDLREALQQHAPRLLLGGCELYDLDSRFRHEIATRPDAAGCIVTCSHTAPTLTTAREMQRATTRTYAA